MRRSRFAAGFLPSASRLGRVLLLGSVASALAAACGGSPDYAASSDPSAGGDDGPGLAGGAGPGPAPGDGGTGLELGLGGVAASAAHGGAGANQPGLEVTAEHEELEVTGEPATVQLTARYDDGSKPNKVVWSVDDAGVGSVSDTGEFRSNGFVAGDVVVTATVGSQTASVTLHITAAISSDPDGLDAQLKDDLVTGGQGGAQGVGPDAGFRFLYPYDKTVFPRGLAAPLLQLGGVVADATYVKISAGTKRLRLATPLRASFCLTRSGAASRSRPRPANGSTWLLPRPAAGTSPVPSASVG